MLLGMSPVGFNRIEPGTFDRSPAHQQADSAGLFGGLIVPADPLHDAFGSVPGGIVADQQQPCAFQLSSQRQQLDDECPPRLAVGIASREIQEAFVPLPTARAKTRDGFVWCSGWCCTLNQLERLFPLHPHGDLGLNQAMKPTLSLFE
jgi:hypothetical protein